ncbi:MAG: hypothetical protein MUP45_01065 [Candidatus Marinimicrobia bacterium]|nr:hypothetical protein [Candidatus Neomarinimicrobiota bacterium]
MLGDEFVSVVVHPDQVTVEMICFSMDAADILFKRFLEEKCFTLIGKEDPVYNTAASTCQAVLLLRRHAHKVVFVVKDVNLLEAVEAWAIKIMEKAGFRQRSGKLLVQNAG